MEPTGSMETMKPPKLLSANSLLGDRVTNIKGEDLGKVEAIMIDLERGRIAFVLLLFGRVNDNKLLAVPWEVLTISFHDKKFILNVSESTLKSAEPFEIDKWRESEDFAWLAKVYRYYGHEPYWK